MPSHKKEKKKRLRFNSSSVVITAPAGNTGFASLGASVFLSIICA